jgi:hypothetical protein
MAEKPGEATLERRQRCPTVTANDTSVLVNLGSVALSASAVDEGNHPCGDVLFGRWDPHPVGEWVDVERWVAVG